MVNPALLSITLLHGRENAEIGFFSAVSLPYIFTLTTDHTVEEIHSVGTINNVKTSYFTRHYLGNTFSVV